MVSFTNKQIKEAIKGSMGNVSLIAKRLGCDWHTAKKFIEAKAVLKKVYETEKETKIDFVENKLLENIQRNDVTSIIFFLKTIGKNRGYIEQNDETSKNTFNLKKKNNKENYDLAKERLEHDKLKTSIELEKIKENTKDNGQVVEITMNTATKPSDWEDNFVDNS